MKYLKTILMSVVVMGLLCAFAKPAAAVPCKTELMPGQTLVLTDDIICGWTTYGIKLGEDSTLDCNGHTIFSIYGGDYGVYAIYLNNGATVKNCKLEGQEAGIVIYSSDSIVVENNEIRGTIYGLDISRGTNITAHSNVLEGNTYSDLFISGNYPWDTSVLFYNNILDRNKAYLYHTNVQMNIAPEQRFDGDGKIIPNKAGGSWWGGNAYTDLWEDCVQSPLYNKSFCADAVILTPAGVPDNYPLRKRTPETQPTPAGTNVGVNFQDSGISAIFDEVTAAGDTIVEGTDNYAQPPAGFEVGGIVYNISTTASYTGSILLSIPYDDTGMTQNQEARLNMMHYENGAWVDVTVPPVDTQNNIITGEVTNLSAFAVMQLVDPVAGIGGLIAVVADMNLHAGIDNSFDSKLQNCAAALSDVVTGNDGAAVNMLSAFINAVEAQSGNKLTVEQADQLIILATAIMGALQAP